MTVKVTGIGEKDKEKNMRGNRRKEAVVGVVETRYKHSLTPPQVTSSGSPMGDRKRRKWNFMFALSLPLLPRSGCTVSYFKEKTFHSGSSFFVDISKKTFKRNESMVLYCCVTQTQESRKTGQGSLSGLE